MKFLSLILSSFTVISVAQAECTLSNYSPDQPLVVNTENTLAQPLDLKELLSINDDCEGRSIDYIKVYASGQGQLSVLSNGQVAEVGDIIINRENIRGDYLSVPNNNFELGRNSGSLQLKVAPYTAGGILKIYRIEVIENRRQ